MIRENIDRILAKQYVSQIEIIEIIKYLIIYIENLEVQIKECL